MVNILDDEECEDNSSSAILVHCLILSGYASSGSTRHRRVQGASSIIFEVRIKMNTCSNNVLSSETVRRT